MRNLIAVFTLLFTLATTTHAQETQNDLDELFEVMNMSATIDTMYSQIESMMMANRNTSGMSTNEYEIVEKYNAKLTQLMKDEMGWEEMKKELRVVYEQNFTSNEIRQMLAFYKSPVGQSVLEKMPVVAQESMQIGQQMAMKAMPKVNALMEQMTRELEQVE